ncbi:hypothetical protein GGX14DRAFT_568872 [Mycena pura]|uniref:Carbohydrate-binding module family 67 protein n=1 Tax=Mycena pura TaxID=153505 RepID=A0AAD6V8D4_9AGAR|nr:hypothetical protein GGX14DRAFT_568872 [Mycena pura]
MRFTNLSAIFSIFAVVAATSLARGATNALSFTSSKWIWTSTTTANAAVILRKDFTPPLGKSLIAAEILIAADDQFSLYVNNELVGSAANANGFAQTFCVDLQPSYNVFAVNASTSASSNGAIIATLLLTYSDGMTTSTVVSDCSWRVSPAAGLPSNWAGLDFDDTAWSTATVAGAFGAQPWGQVAIPSGGSTLTLAGTQWVWTNIVAPGGQALPISTRAFRRTITLPSGQSAAGANILITADDAYTLYVNGVQVGSGSSWEVAQHYVVNFSSEPNEIVFAVLGNNTVDNSPAGIIVAAEINLTPSGRAGSIGCSAGLFASTDTNWVSTKGTIPSGWEQPGFDDSAWPAVVDEAVYGTAVWGAVPVQAALAPVTV